MRGILVIAVLATTAPAATNRVCLEPEPGSAAKCTEPAVRAAAHAFPEPHATTWERTRWISTGVAIGAALYDVHTTQQVLAAGGAENNFLYGSHPSTARLYGFSLGLVVGQTLLIEWWRHRHPENARSIDQRGFFLNVGASAIYIAAGVHNESVPNQRPVDKSLQIGIGGSLAASPLPHHRTCGSAYGGSVT
jgi:hypothetical protein